MSFLTGRIKSLKFALRGMFLLIRTEHAIISQLSIGSVLLVLGLCFGISKIEWIIQLLLLGAILAVESLNTAVEKLCDFIHPDYHERIGFIKDISAGAVSFIVIVSFVVVCIIYYPYIF